MRQANTKWNHIHLGRQKLFGTWPNVILHAATSIFPSVVKDAVGLSNINWKHSNSGNFAFIKIAGHTFPLFSVLPR
jgi:hypothetical protein